MSNKKLLEDRFRVIQDHASENYINLTLELDPVADKWTAWNDDDLLTDPCEGLEELVEALEAEFNL